MGIYSHFFEESVSVVDALCFDNNSHGEGWTAKEASYLERALPAFVSCKQLSLQRHSLSDLGAEHLSRAILGNAALLYLNLGSNSIGDAGAGHLASMLKHNSALCELR